MENKTYEERASEFNEKTSKLSEELGVTVGVELIPGNLITRLLKGLLKITWALKIVDVRTN